MQTYTKVGSANENVSDGIRTFSTWFGGRWREMYCPGKTCIG